MVRHQVSGRALRGRNERWVTHAYERAIYPWFVDTARGELDYSSVLGYLVCVKRCDHESEKLA